MQPSEKHRDFFCRWDFCTRVFPSLDQAGQHFKDDHLPNEIPIYITPEKKRQREDGEWVWADTPKVSDELPMRDSQTTGGDITMTTVTDSNPFLQNLTPHLDVGESQNSTPSSLAQPNSQPPNQSPRPSSKRTKRVANSPAGPSQSSRNSRTQSSPITASFTAPPNGQRTQKAPSQPSNSTPSKSTTQSSTSTQSSFLPPTQAPPPSFESIPSQSIHSQSDTSEPIPSGSGSGSGSSSKQGLIPKILPTSASINFGGIEGVSQTNKDGSVSSGEVVEKSGMTGKKRLSGGNVGFSWGGS